MRQVGRTLTTANEGLLRDHRILVCDRDRTWSLGAKRLLEDAAIHVVHTRWRAPSGNA